MGEGVVLVEVAGVEDAEPEEVGKGLLHHSMVDLNCEFSCTL